MQANQEQQVWVWLGCNTMLLPYLIYAWYGAIAEHEENQQKNPQQINAILKKKPHPKYKWW